ncbi:MAG: nuclear transport factor 2 family protein [Cytophagaceae bacterium]|nr:nuclear transport factor 2 family protein [Cytophagaceae bacterium]
MHLNSPIFAKPIYASWKTKTNNIKTFKKEIKFNFKNTTITIHYFSNIFFNFCFGQSKSELEIRQLENYWAELLDKSDTTALSKVWSKDYIVNNPTGKIITGNDIIGFIRNGRSSCLQRIIESVIFSKPSYSDGRNFSTTKDALGIEQKM